MQIHNKILIDKFSFSGYSHECSRVKLRFALKLSLAKLFWPTLLIREIFKKITTSSI